MARDVSGGRGRTAKESTGTTPSLILSGEVESLQVLQERAREIAARLRTVFGEANWQNPGSPMDELVRTILSQNTNDRNRDVAFARLKAAFPDWEAVRDAPVERIAEAIRPGGLSRQKAERIKELLAEISAQRGSFDLSFLGEIPLEDAQAWLTGFKGVGPKTAAIVLLFCFGRPAFPVDTHIYRVTGRLGLRPQKMSVEGAHRYLAQLFPAEDYAMTHLNLIRLGREICQARVPLCSICPLNDLCDYYQTQVRGDRPVVSPDRRA